MIDFTLFYNILLNFMLFGKKEISWKCEKHLIYSQKGCLKVNRSDEMRPGALWKLFDAHLLALLHDDYSTGRDDLTDKYISYNLPSIFAFTFLIA